MNKEEIKKFAKETILNSPLGYRKSLSPYKKLLEEFYSIRTGDFKKDLYHFINGLEEIPLCSVCRKNPKSFSNIKDGYKEVCSPKCAAILGGIANKTKIQNSTIEEISDINRKRKQTNQRKYGVEYPLQYEGSKQKFKNTCIEKYGVDHYMKNDSFFEIFKSNFNEKYGVDFYFQTDESRKRSSELITKNHSIDFFRKYFQDKNGVDSFWQTEEGIRLQLSKVGLEHIFDNIEEYLKGERLFELSEMIGLSSYMIKKILVFKGIDYKPEYHMSSFQREIYKFILSYIPETEVFLNDRNVLNGKELDIYLPRYRLAIECNGVYYHTDKFKNQNYHREKYVECQKQNIQLIQISDLDFYKQKEKWFALLRAKIGIFDKIIYARKCEIKLINDKESKNFLEENHMQGYVSAKIVLGLYHDSKLIALSSFSKPRFNRKYNFELLRFCSKKDLSVCGGFSKLLAHFEKTYMKPGESILSYAHGFWSIGDIYEKNNFNLVDHTNGNYIWTNGKLSYTRYACQVYKLKKLYGEEVKTENQFMREKMGMRKYYDAGNLVYVKLKREPEGSL